MDIQFLGATGRVTGSCYLIRVGGKRILLECGLVQGSNEEEEENRASFPFDPAAIDAVVLSHAHIDHSGRLPLLMKQGFTGPIYTHHASRALCTIMLRDSGYLHEKDALWANRKRRRQGLPLLAPLYTQDDGEAVMHQFHGLAYGAKTEILPGFSIRLRNAGHILGSAIVEAWIAEGGVERKLVFSGDLGFVDAPVMPDPETVAKADLVLLESTYGDRQHRSVEATLEELEAVFAHRANSSGNIIIPAFAVGRTQDLLYLMAEHFDQWRIGNYQVFLDSPMAIEATTTYSQYRHLFDTELFRPGKPDTRLRNLTLSRTSQDSMAINEIDSGAIIIAGSGMCSGGRVMHHLKHNLWKYDCQVIIVGYQAHGTLGRRLVDGADQVRIMGEEIRVNARIHTVGGLSAHADQSGLVDWYRQFEGAPPVCLVHGEPDAQAELAGAIRTATQAQVRIPKRGETIDLARLTV
ncbi:MAG TPA: MBL fold metallo-hydrolase [Gammaproteobacteria bacterium]